MYVSALSRASCLHGLRCQGVFLCCWRCLLPLRLLDDEEAEQEALSEELGRWSCGCSPPVRDSKGDSPGDDDEEPSAVRCRTQTFCMAAKAQQRKKSDTDLQ